MSEEKTKTESTETKEITPAQPETEVTKTESTETKETSGREPAPGTGAHDTKTD